VGGLARVGAFKEKLSAKENKMTTEEYCDDVLEPVRSAMRELGISLTNGDRTDYALCVLFEALNLMPPELRDLPLKLSVAALMDIAKDDGKHNGSVGL
jgi:hypothetical protein